MSHTHLEPALTSCANCDAALHGPYCAACGQKAAALNPSLHDFAHDLTHEFLHFDGKIVQTVRLLLTRPGLLTREHFEGRRQRYVSPIRLYLLFSVLYFGVAALAPSAGFQFDFAPDADASAEQLRWFAERLPEAQKITSEAYSHWVPRAMFVLVPVFAALVGLATRGTGRNYPQHLYFAMHVHAAWFVAGAVDGLARIGGVPVLTPLVGVAALTYVVSYFWLALRRAYGFSAAGTTARMLAIGTPYVLLLGALMVAFMMAVVRQAFGGGAAGGH